MSGTATMFKMNITNSMILDPMTKEVFGLLKDFGSKYKLKQEVVETPVIMVLTLDGNPQPANEKRLHIEGHLTVDDESKTGYVKFVHFHPEKYHKEYSIQKVVAFIQKDVVTSIPTRK